MTPNEKFYKQKTMPDLISGQESLPIPQSIGPYKIESLLNQGGMSLLYLGFHPETKQSIVIKVLSPSYINHPEAVTRFLKETAIIAMTHHPNIVKLYGQGEWEKGLYIAMEFIRGISLRSLIMEQTLSMRRTLEIILQVSYALLHLHSHGVIHRDLKPENILMAEDGEIKVIDFGIAQMHDEKTRETQTEKNQLIGTPNYMSPEQKEHPPTISFASDIYSLGIILYELVIGKLSYGMVNLSLLPKHLRNIVGKALAVSPKERTPDSATFIHEISQYLHSKEIEKEKPGDDQIKEIYETLQRTIQNLSPVSPPAWPEIEIGIAKLRSSLQLGLYYDFFRLPNNSYLMIMAVSSLQEVDSAVYTGMLSAIIHILIQTTNTAKFKIDDFLNTLNTACSKHLNGLFALNALVLDSLSNQITYLSMGMPDLIHLPDGGATIRKLSSQNEPLGSHPHQTFSKTTDNWNEGDTLIVHSLISDDESFGLMLENAIAESSILSAQSQAEAILKRLSPSSHSLAYPKALIVIQRIA